MYVYARARLGHGLLPNGMKRFVRRQVIAEIGAPWRSATPSGNPWRRIPYRHLTSMAQAVAEATLLPQEEGQRGDPLALHTVIWFVIVVASPVYVFPAGLPQPFHILMAVTFSAFLVTLMPLVLNDRYLIITLWSFVGYVSVVNGLWSAAMQNSGFLVSTLYVVFNALAFLYAVAVARLVGPRLIATTLAAVALGIAIQLLAILGDLAEPHASGGALGTLTNPNQLAHWALLVVTAVLVVKIDQRLTLFDAGVIMGGIVLVFLSLSRSGLISITLLTAVVLAIGPKSRALRAGTAVVVFAATVLMLVWPDVGREVIGLKVAEAELSRETLWDSPSGRGYDRIWLFPEHLLLGAGEGGNERFAVAPLFFNNELHSSFGTIVFSYGVVGALLFCAFLLGVFRRLNLRLLVYLGPLFVFGLAHNGFRFSLFWMVLGLAYGRHALQKSSARPLPAASIDGLEPRPLVRDPRLPGVGTGALISTAMAGVGARWSKPAGARAMRRSRRCTPQRTANADGPRTTGGDHGAGNGGSQCSV